MGSTYWTSKRTEIGDHSNITLTTTTTIPADTSITVTLFEQVENDGTGANTDALGNNYDNSSSVTLSGGSDETNDLSGFDGGGTDNAYWAKFQVDGDGTDPTLSSASVDSLSIEPTSGAVSESGAVSATGSPSVTESSPSDTSGSSIQGDSARVAEPRTSNWRVAAEFVAVSESGAASATATNSAVETAVALEVAAATPTATPTATESNVGVFESGSTLGTATQAAIETAVANETGFASSTSTPSAIETALALELGATASTATPTATESNVGVFESGSSLSTSTPAITSVATVFESGSAGPLGTPYSRERFGDIFFGYISDWDSLQSSSNVSHADDVLSLSGADEGEAITAKKQSS